MENNFKYTAEESRREIENILYKIGFLCRVFARGKDDKSLNKKLNKEEGNYYSNGKLIQDAIGIRVAFYFEEDIDIVSKLLIEKFDIDKSSSAIDNHSTDQFTVTRHNLIFQVPQHYKNDMKRSISDMPIDSTFEVQLRSILSEGWHEVDHDLRYKSKTSWNGHDDLSRALNGILATIETAEWGMRKIFDDLSYRHYKKGNWEAMLHNKMRLRVEPKLSQPILEHLNNNIEFAKDAFRIDRKSVIQKIAQLKPNPPISLDNLLFIWNYIGPKNDELLSLTPVIILEGLESDNSL
ncbi:MAG: hypothetical protein ACXW1A_03970 [Nitrososphaeraceae archaeon]